MNSSNGLGLVPVLTLLFVVLKLAGLVAWPWVGVLSPLWISALLFLFLLAVAGAILNSGVR